VEDVRYAEREAEDYAEYAGPGGGVLALAHDLRLSPSYVRIPLSVYTYDNDVSSCSQLSSNGSARGSSLLKFRDLNSSASVMTGEDVRCGSKGVL